MRIGRVDLYLFVQPWARPLVGSVTSGGSMHTLVAVVSTDDGLTGQGYGWAINETHATYIRQSLQVAADFLLGRDPMRLASIWSDFGRLSNFVGQTGLAIIGMSIMDIACWDIASRATGVPLWKLLGGHKDRAPMYLNLADSDPDGQTSAGTLAASIDDGRAQGFTAFKVRLGVNDPLTDAQRVRNLVDHLGGTADLAVDIAQRWTARESRLACAAMDDLGLRWIEDPAPYDDINGIRDLVQRTTTPICTGENAYGLADPHRLVTEIGADYLMLDLQRCGGITGWRKAAALAEANHISVTTHTYPHVGVHLICGTENATIGENMPWWDSLLGGPLEIEDGTAAPGNDPGIGFRVADELLSTAIWSESFVA